jgi:hypothetical protein
MGMERSASKGCGLSLLNISSMLQNLKYLYCGIPVKFSWDFLL